MELPSSVTIVEVGPRDGLQNEPGFMPTEQKVQLIKDLCQAGLREIEVTSFVHPKAVPQLADAEHMLAAIRRDPAVTYWTLIPNQKGLERAIAAGIKHVVVVISCSDAHNKENINMTVDESVERLIPLIRLAHEHKVTVRGGVATAFGCAIQGEVPLAKVEQVATAYVELGVEEVCFADTSGMANPRQVTELLRHMKPLLGGMAFGLHIHDTRGMGLANIWAGFLEGATSIDTSIGGLGGCPFSPGATGNVATEDVVHMFESMGVDTGIVWRSCSSAPSISRACLARESTARYRSRVRCPGRCARADFQLGKRIQEKIQMKLPQTTPVVDAETKLQMTLAQKILAAHAGKQWVEPGEFVRVKVDFIFSNETMTSMIIEQLNNLGSRRFAEPKRVMLIPDHNTPNMDIPTAELVKNQSELAEEQGCWYFEVGRGGIEHVVLPEQGLVLPGDVVLGADSHSVTHGAVGALATGMGATDIAMAMATGETWMQVPQTIKINYHGKLPDWIGGKDLILYTLGQIGVSGAAYRVIEFGGEAVSELSMDGRFTVSNMTVEAGANAGIFPVDEKTLEYVRPRAKREFTVYQADSGAEYEGLLDFDISNLESQVSFPHLPSNARNISDVGDIPINQVYLGAAPTAG